jgi:putative MATE family efflux protein
VDVERPPGTLDRRIAALAIPALGALAVEPLYVLVDTAIVGRLGSVPLGGLALASAVLNMLLWVCNFLSYGTTARISFLTGKGEHGEAAGVAAQGFWLCAFLGIPIAVVIAIAGRPMAIALGGHGDILETATTYLRISALGIPAVLVALVGHGHLRGLSDTRTPLKVVLVANVLNVVLEVVLVYGFHFGIAGSAWGTVIAQWVAAVWFLQMSGRRIARAGARFAPKPKEIRRLLVIGRHLLIRTGALVITLTLSTSVAARLGTSQLGGHQIAFQVQTFLALAIDALAIAAQAMVGTQLGSGDIPGALETAKRLIHFGWFVGVGLAALVVLSAPFLPHVFSGDHGVTQQATLALIFVGVNQIPGSYAFVLDGILMGGSDFRFLQWNTVTAGLAFLPVAVAVLVWPWLGLTGLWSGLVLWMTVRAVMSAWRFRGDAWSRHAY